MESKVERNHLKNLYIWRLFPAAGRQQFSSQNKSLDVFTRWGLNWNNVDLQGLFKKKSTGNFLPLQLPTWLKIAFDLFHFNFFTTANWLYREKFRPLNIPLQVPQTWNWLLFSETKSIPNKRRKHSFFGGILHICISGRAAAVNVI